MLKADLKRFIISIEMLVAIVITAACLGTGLTYISSSLFQFDNYSLIYMYNFCVFTGLLSLFFSIIVAIPIVNTVIDEQESGFKNMILTRTSRKKYVYSRLTAVAITGFCTLFFGSVLFLLICYLAGIRCVVTSEHMAETIIENTTYWTLIEHNKSFIALLLMIVVLSMSGVGRAIIILALSYVVKNKYIALILPFVLERILVILFTPLESVSKLFFYLNPVVWDAFGTEMINSACGGLIYVFIIQICLALIGILAYSICVRRQYLGGH